jgi:hypothetical protein
VFTASSVLRLLHRRAGLVVVGGDGLDAEKGGQGGLAVGQAEGLQQGLFLGRLEGQGHGQAVDQGLLRRRAGGVPVDVQTAPGQIGRQGRQERLAVEGLVGIGGAQIG